MTISESDSPRPAVTLIVLRDTDAGIETLLLRRNEALVFAGGYWVFPGGAIDPEDVERAGGDLALAARHAAAREAWEEARLAVAGDPDELIVCGTWIGPTGETKRYSTEYFLYRCDTDSPIIVDGSEIVDYCWLGIDEALRRNLAGDLPLYPPTWFTLHQLSRFQRADDCISALRAVTPLHVLPVFSKTEGRHIALFEGDAGYRDGCSDHDGARHRMWQKGLEWHYEYIDVSAGIRPLDGRDL